MFFKYLITKMYHLLKHRFREGWKTLIFNNIASAKNNKTALYVRTCTGKDVIEWYLWLLEY